MSLLLLFLSCRPPPTQLPDNGLSQLANRLLLFRHDYNSPNVLQLVNAASEVIDETLIEIVLTANCEYSAGQTAEREKTLSTEHFFPLFPF